MSAEDPTGGVRAVGRALDILLAFEPADQGLSASDLLERVPLSRPTLYRLLYTLEQRGFVTSSGEPQRWRLGPAVARMAHVWGSSLDLSALAQPVMRSLRDSTGETVALFVPQGDYRQCVAELPSLQPLSFKRGAGYSERIVRGASGRVMLAFAPDPDAQLKACAKGMKIDKAQTLRELRAIARQGYAVSKNELIEGAVAIAVPFFDGTGQVAGSLAVFGPQARLGETRIRALGKLLVQQGHILSGSLGHTSPAAHRTD